MGDDPEPLPPTSPLLLGLPVMTLLLLPKQGHVTMQDTSTGAGVTEHSDAIRITELNVT